MARAHCIEKPSNRFEATSQSSVNKKRSLSSNAENFVADELTRQGWDIIARNFRKPGFELDLVAKKGSTLAVVEVKARNKAPLTGRQTEILLTSRKKSALIRGTRYFVSDQTINARVIRIDLAIVWPRGVKYYPAVIDF